MIQSVKFKLAAFISFAIIIGGAVLEVYHYNNGRHILLEDAKKRGQTIADNFAFNAYTGVYAQQADPIQPLVAGVKSDPNVLYVRVVAYVKQASGDTTQVLLTDDERVKGAFGMDPLTSGATGRGGMDAVEQQVSGRRFYDIASPVTSQAGSGGLGALGMDLGTSNPDAASQKLGFVEVGYDLAPAYAQANRFAVISFSILVAICVLGIALAWFIASAFVSPLISIVAVSRKIAQGDLSQLVEGRSANAHDELGELMRSFNQMVLDLRRSRAEVEEYNRTLSQKVEERTQEVEQAYADLKSSQEAQTAYSSVLRVFNETADVDTILKEGISGLMKFTGAALGAVHMWDDRDRRFHTSVTQGLTRKAIPAFELGEGIAGRAAQERKLLLLSGLGENARWVVRTSAGDLAPQEILAIPIIYRDAVLGVLELAIVGTAFDGERQRLLEDLVGQFAIALSNVIANDRTRQLAETLQAKGRELEQQNRTLSEQSTALQRQQRELDEKNKDLERASKLKSEFLANMSHELRTPMNSIIGYTDLVLNRASETLDPRHKKNLDKVLGNAQHLLSLINGILDLSKIEAGKMEVYVEEFELPPLLESTATMAEVLLKQKPVKLVQKIDPALPRIRTDKTKLRQIVLNLLSNACKFTEQGEVVLIAEPIDGRRKGDPNRLLKIEVKDSGIGIAEKDIPIIFEEFRQVDGSSTRKYGGTGLGLAIVKKMVQLMGGEITVSSTLGEGSTFTIVLPLGEGAGLAAGTIALAAPTATTDQKLEAVRDRERGVLRAESATIKIDDDDGKKVVLVVDDEPDSVILVRENLAGQPYRVVSAFTAEEGLKMAVKLKPFCILLDIMMPDRDGWDLIRDLKANTDTVGIPVVILSIVDNKPLGFSLGVTDYLLKPVEREQLLTTLSRVSIRPVRDVLVVDDDEGVREILEDMLKKDGYGVALAKNGIEAIAALGRKTPDLVILDLMMPEMDGFEVVRHMRSNPAWAEIPVLICTAKELTGAERADLQRSVSKIVEKGQLQADILLGELTGALRNIEQQVVARADRDDTAAAKKAAR